MKLVLSINESNSAVSLHVSLASWAINLYILLPQAMLFYLPRASGQVLI